MPVVVARTTLKNADEGFSLALVASHRLQMGASPAPIKTTGRVPEFDIVPHADLVLSVSGVRQKHNITGSKMLVAYPTRHLLSTLKTNSVQLGLSSVSDVYLDPDDGLAKITLSPMRAYKPQCNCPKLRLQAIDLIYHFRPKTDDGNTDFDIFSQSQYLPYMAALDRVAARFLAALVRRYPLIFGPWIRKLEAEAMFFTPLSRSLHSLAGRSQSKPFQQAFRRLIDDLEDQQSAIEMAARRVAVDYFQLDSSDLPEQDDGDTDVLSLSLCRLLRCRIRPPVFKTLHSAKAGFLATPELRVEERSLSPEDVQMLPPPMLQWEDAPSPQATPGLELDLEGEPLLLDSSDDRDAEDEQEDDDSDDWSFSDPPEALEHSQLVDDEDQAYPSQGYSSSPTQSSQTESLPTPAASQDLDGFSQVTSAKDEPAFLAFGDDWASDDGGDDDDLLTGPIDLDYSMHDSQYLTATTCHRHDPDDMIYSDDDGDIPQDSREDAVSVLHMPPGFPDVDETFAPEDDEDDAAWRLSDPGPDPDSGSDFDVYDHLATGMAAPSSINTESYAQAQSVETGDPHRENESDSDDMLLDELWQE